MHVGLALRPVKAEDISQHVMHRESYEVTEAAAAEINEARRRGGRIVAVGTTSLRTLNPLLMIKVLCIRAEVKLTFYCSGIQI